MAPPLVPKVRYQGRPAFRLLLGCLIGIILNNSGLLLWGSAFILLMALTGFLLTKRIPEVEVYSWILVWSVVFGCYSYLRTLSMRDMPSGLTLHDTEIRILYPLSSSSEGDVQYRVKVLTNDDKWLDIRLQIPRDDMIPKAFHHGSKAKATLDLASLSTLKSSSFKRYLLSEGIEAQGYLQSIKELQKLKHPPLRSTMQELRQRITDKFDIASFPYLTAEQRGVLYALGLGDRSQLPTKVKSSFTSSGVAHILAVSGYHLGVVYGIVNLILGFFFWRYNQRHWRYSILLVTLIIYTSLSGASTATLRALLMSSIIIGSKLLARRTDPIQVLSLTLVIFLLINPLSYLSIGLMLSLGAVWGIYVFLPLFHRIFRPNLWSLRQIMNIISVSVAAQLGVIPMLFLYFGTATLSFIWSNVPLIIISGVLIPLALFSMLMLMMIGSLPPFIFELLGILSQWMISITDFFSSEFRNLSISYKFDIILVLLSYAIIHTIYLLLHSYTCRLEMLRLIEKNSKA